MRSFAYNHPLMALTSGTKLGPYQILSSIGAGGMGEVYRARDSRLSRDVAIKVLPASFSADPDRLQRFAQECRATAALNHPNILSIFDIGENLAAPYVVSELLEGENLRDRLREGPIPARKAIDYAKQIASGLAAAHEKGITHRDLKPENLFITTDGRIKILDFGLAKLTRPEPDDSGDAPTQQIATDAGTVMGTVGYMAPEQVRGKPADSRSDIFAFGAILYETLSGKRAFHGDSPVDTMSAILKEEPPDLTETNRNVPSALERIVRHCLEKNPAERFQSARDLAFNLDALSELSTSRSGAQPLPVEKERATRRSLTIAVASVLLLASLVAIYLFAHRRAPTNPTFHEITFRNGTIWDARFAPDGQTIVYGANWEGAPAELFTTRSDSTDSRSVGLPSAQILSISSKGEMAINLGAAPYTAFRLKGTLARVPLVGGAPREVLDGVHWADWGPDGESFAVIRPTTGGGDDLEYPIGNVIYSPVAWVSHVRFSPNGEYLAIADHVPSGDDGRIVIIDKHGNHIASSSFLTSVQGLAWSPNGKEVWFSAVPNGAARSLYALDLSGKERLIYRAPGGVTIHDISRSGLVLLTADKTRLGLFALAPGATHERSLSWFDWSLLTDLSADGKTLLFSESGEAMGNGLGSLFLRNTDGSAAVRLGEGGFGKLSPDGKWALISSGNPAKLMLLPTGAGQPRQLIDNKMDHFATGWLADNKTIFFGASEMDKPRRSYVLDIDSPGAAPKPITPEGAIASYATPDGKFLLAGNGKHEYSLIPVDGGTPQKLNLDLQPDEFPIGFIDNGKSVLARTRGLPVKITRIDLATGKRSAFKEIVPADPAGAQSIVSLRFSADGQSYAYSLGRWLSDLYVVDGLK
jgi:eukaryotic-like serine/threonine-protein kinase